MSIFSGIAAAEHTFVAWFEKEATAFEKKEPGIVKVVSAGVSYCGAALNIALADIDPAALVIVNPIIAEVQKDLTVVSSTVYDFGATPTAASIFSGISTDLNSLLSAGHITSTAAVSAIKKAIGEVGALGSAIELLVSGASTTKAATA